MALPAITALSDDDGEEATDLKDSEARKSFRCTCHEPCYVMFSKGGAKEAEHNKHLMQFTSMHKMDQDHAMFDHLRCQALAQGCLDLLATGSAERHKSKLRHSYCNVHVCRSAYESLMVIGRGHILLWKAAKHGQTSPPVDMHMRYFKKVTALV